MKIIIEDKKVMGIPVIDVYNMDMTDKAPIIIILHGFTSCKEHNLYEAYKFVRQGFFVTIFDAYLHGEIASENFNQLSFLEQMKQGTEITWKTIEYIDLIIDNNYQTPKADVNKIGLIGFSMGGSIIYKYLSKEIRPNIKAAVPVIATPKYGDTFKERYENDPEAVPYLNIIEETRKMEIGQYYRLMQVKDFPLLIMNGENDPMIPIGIVKNCYSQMKQNYSEQEKIQMIEYKGIGHQVTEDMIEKACLWFQKFLL